MAVRKKKIERRILKLLRKPTLIGFLSLLAYGCYAFLSPDIEERKLVGYSPRVIDGDTIHLGGISVRLQGIDAPELKQKCTEKVAGKSIEYSCGSEAMAHLIKLVGNKKIVCTDEGKDFYKRQLSYCFAGDLNINKQMVRDGYAVAYSYYDVSFVVDEMIAKGKKRGIWRGDFQNPSDWRKKKKRARG